MTLPKKLKKGYKELLTKVPDPSPTKERFLEGILCVYNLNYYMVVSHGEFYFQFAFWEGNENILCEIVGEKYLEEMQYTDLQKNRILELGFTIDEMFGNYQKVLKITKSDDLPQFIRLFTKVSYEIMSFPKSTVFEFEIEE